MSTFTLSHLDALESEAVHIFREVAGEFALGELVVGAGGASLRGAAGLTANDLGRITLRSAEPLPLDAYAVSRRTGAFILIDPRSAPR
jgi:sulfate adenylyltransferase subunit 1 (EFTu-like GTPase family)